MKIGKTGITASLKVNKSDEVKKALDSQIKAALYQCGLDAQHYADLLCPRVTGRLHNSITFTIYGDQGGTYKYQDDGKDSKGNKSPEGKKQYEYEYGAVGEEKSMYIGTNVEYAPYVEEGSKGRVARHFIKNAIENHKDEYRGTIEKYLRGEV